MLTFLRKFWHRAFLEERPSISLSLFRPFLAFTVGAHVLPTLFNLPDNYFSTAFRTQNPSFFPLGVLERVNQSPDWLVSLMAVVFYVALSSFFLGLYSQASCLVLTFSCYYFYALNSLHIGTLSFDILLVTLFLACLSPYLGDFLSLDALDRKDASGYKRLRPIFIQRLLQLQVASTYFYTALNKFCARGNWFSDNPLYYLYNGPADGVIKHFPFRDFFAARPELCYWLGVVIIAWELGLGFLLFWKRTRGFAIITGFIFHLLLVLTMHVPTIFLFLFPPLLCLFIEPETLTSWIEKRQQKNLIKGQDLVIFDGECGFCRRSLEGLKTMDVFGRLKYLDFHVIQDFKFIHPRLSEEKCRAQMQLVTRDGLLFEGFAAFRVLSWRLPYLWVVAPLLNFPGMGWIGHPTYKFVAANRKFFSRIF